MSAGASVNALQRLVEQLKLEAAVERIKLFRSLENEHKVVAILERQLESCLHNIGLPGRGGASAVLRAERLQGRPAGGRAGRRQPLPGAQILCSALNPGKKQAKECLQAQSDECLPPSLQKAFFPNQMTFRYFRPSQWPGPVARILQNLMSFNSNKETG